MALGISGVKINFLTAWAGPVSIVLTLAFMIAFGVYVLISVF